MSNRSHYLLEENKRSYIERVLIKNCDQRFNFFNNRITQAWNAIPDEILTANNKNSFKNKLDEYLLR